MTRQDPNERGDCFYWCNYFHCDVKLQKIKPVELKFHYIFPQILDIDRQKGSIIRKLIQENWKDIPLHELVCGLYYNEFIFRHEL